MASGHHSQEGVPENLRKQLAVAVRSIQWSYAIFWNISSSQPGVLEWGDGYYNGHIKTRKTVLQAVEFNADQLGLQRSEQLRELYKSLAEGESSPQSRRPSWAALSPEDLSDTEWFYLVCMSFVFNVGQGLPGRALANGQPIWLCNANYADSKVFSRSLLAKSASIQTVVCFPFLGGVVELGVTEMVLEDPSLIQHIKTSFLEIPYPIVTQISRSVSGNARNDKDFVYVNSNPIVECKEVKVCSPYNSSNRIGLDQQAEESIMIEGLNGRASQAQSWQFMDGEVSDCISQILVINPENVSPILKGDKENNDSLLELQEDNQTRLTSLGLQADEIRYQSFLSTLLKPPFQNCNQESSFVKWKRGGSVGIDQMPQSETPQRLLKKVLFEVARMHGDFLLDSREDNGRRESIWRPHVDDIDSSHVLAERRRREKINERFLSLGLLVPSTGKVDKVSILDNTIKHVKELEKKVKELESTAKLEARTSTDYDTKSSCNSKKTLINKRKACEIDEMEPEINQVILRDSSTDNVTVSMVEKDVLIDIRCNWRDFLLLDVMDAINRLHLVSHSIQSTNNDGILSMTIKSKFKGTTVASAEAIRKALQRVVQNC